MRANYQIKKDTTGESHFFSQEKDIIDFINKKIKPYYVDNGSDALLEIAHQDYEIIDLDLKEDVKCPKCGRRLCKSDNEDYSYQCWYCDEDFYSIEVDKNA